MNTFEFIFIYDNYQGTLDDSNIVNLENMLLRLATTLDMFAGI